MIFHHREEGSKAAQKIELFYLRFSWLLLQTASGALWSQTYRKKELLFIWRADKSDNIFQAEINHRDQIHHFQHRFDHLVVYKRAFKKGRKVYDCSRSRANISIRKHYWNNLLNEQKITFSTLIISCFYLFIIKIFLFLEFW